MKTQVWLAFTQSGAVRATKRRPDLGANERAMLLTVEIPDEAFRRPPVLTATVQVPVEGVVGPVATVQVEPTQVETETPVAVAPGAREAGEARDTDEPPACGRCQACLDGLPYAFPSLAGG